MEIISIISPCLNEELNIDIFCAKINEEFSKLNYDYEIIFIDDGSTDSTWVQILKASKVSSKIKAIKFSRNFGLESAIYAGLKNSIGNAAVIIDVDLQDPIELIPNMILEWKNGFSVVTAKRSKRPGDSLFKKVTAHCYYFILSFFSSSTIPTNTGMFRLIDRNVIEIIIELPERTLFLREISSWVGFKQTHIEFVRGTRKAGETSFTLNKMLKLAIDGLFTQPFFVTKLLFYFGFISTVFIIISTSFFNISLKNLIIFLIIFQTFLISILSVLVCYLFDEVRSRPKFIIDKIINIPLINQKIE